MDESEFITAIYQQGKSLKPLKIHDKVEAHSADALRFKHFHLNTLLNVWREILKITVKLLR